MAGSMSDERHALRPSGESWSSAGNPPLAPGGARPIRPLLDASAWVVGAMWLFIAGVSALDVYLSIKYQYRLVDEELNPLGRWLMALDGGSVGLFMACKFFGNVVALATLQALYFSYRTICLIATTALTALQGLLAIALLV